MDFKDIYNEAIPTDAIRVDGNFDEVYAAAMKSDEFRESTLTNERIMEATIGERLSNIGRAIKDGLSKIFDMDMLGSFTVDQASEVAKKFWIRLKALQSGLDSLVDNLYYDAACCIRIGGYEIGDMFPSEAKILGGQTYIDDTYGRNPDWRLADLIKFELLSGGNSWAKELKWVDSAYNKGFDASKYSKKEFFAMFIARVEELAEKDLDNKLKKDTAKTQKKLDKENHISKKDRELTQMRKDFLGESKLSEGGYTTFTNHIGEKDSFYDPYKKEPADVPYEEVFASNNWEARFFKGLDFSTKEGIEKAAKRWESNYFSDLVHDIAHDGDRAGAREASNALMKLQRTIHEKARELGLKSADVEEPLKKMLYRTEQHEKRVAAAEKGKETKAINSKIKVQTYIKELKDLDLPAEVRELFAPDGYYKERRSYGVIKNYLDKPYGKALMAVWKDQFAN